VNLLRQLRDTEGGRGEKPRVRSNKNICSLGRDTGHPYCSRAHVCLLELIIILPASPPARAGGKVSKAMTS
jgi:hypothetical protein